MHRMSLRSLVIVGIVLACQSLAFAQQDVAQEIEAAARKSGDLVVIDVSLSVAASPREAWDVLTDYDHMPGFLPNLRVSKTLSRSPTQLRVAQQGGVSHGPISLNFDVVRDVQLKPYQEIISHVISGNLKKVDATTRLAPEGKGTRISFHSESIPNVWVPPAIGPTMIVNETRDQFSAMRGEIMRRKSASKLAPPGASHRPLLE